MNVETQLWWQTGGYPILKEVQVVRETKKQIVLLEKNRATNCDYEARVAKISDYHCYFKTFAEAKAYLVGKARSKLLRNEQQHKALSDHLKEMEAL